MTKDLPVRIRDLRAGDINFVLKSWLKSYKESMFATNIPGAVYFDEHKQVIMGELARGSEIVVAVNEEDDDQIIGFLCFDRTRLGTCLIVHYIYVKSPFRKMGVGRVLMDEAIGRCDHNPDLPIVITHSSRDFGRFWPSYAVYNPYLLGAIR